MSTAQAPEHIKLTDTNKMVRDPHSKGLIATDKAGLAAYRAQRKSTEQIVILERDINSMKDELSDIKQLLLSCFPQKQSA